MFAADLVLELANLGREKLHRGAALGAHHVVMAAPVVLMLVAGDAVVKRNFAGQAATGQELQRAVDGSKADAGIFFLDQPVQFVGREMLARFEKRSQDGTALFGLLQPDAFEVSQENALRFADVLPRNRWLIVDSFLRRSVRREKSGRPGDSLRDAIMILGSGD